MINRNKFLFCIIIFSILSQSYKSSNAQTLLKAKVVDVFTQEQLAFVNILYDTSRILGTATDINGDFIIRSDHTIKSITLSYVGYQTKTVTYEMIKSTNAIIELFPQAIFLNEVTIMPKENPANEIMKRVIENKEINNPEKMRSFSYKTYNHCIYELNPNNLLINSSEVIDSSLSRLIRFSEKMHILIMESVTERKFIYPDKSHENVIANRVSGFKNPTFASLATNYQPFTFYEDVLNILDRHYVNPICNNSYKKYLFEIKDTIYSELDTVYIISFEPHPNKNFDALKGLLYINTKKYAIQNVIAKPYEKGLIDIKLEQMYSFIDSQQWFPVQLNFEIILKYYPRKEIGFKVSGKSYIRDIKLNPNLNKEKFALEAVTMEDSASTKDSAFWNRYRRVPLTAKELKTYNIVDSIGDKYKVDNLFKSIERTNIGRLAIGFLDIELNKIYAYNETEGSRLGLGLFTNNNIFRFFSLGGYFGYGFNDKKWKYGSSLTFFLNKRNEAELKLYYLKDVIEPARSTIKYGNKMFDIIDYMAKNIDYFKEKKISFGFRGFKYALFNLSLSQNQKKVGYDYYYFPEFGGNDSSNVFNFTEFNFSLRYAYREKLIQSMGQRFIKSSNYPILYFSYTRGLKNLLDGEYEYNKYEFGVYKKFIFKYIGRTTIRLEGGLVDKQVPYSVLFTSRASYNKSIPMMVEKTFHTMRFNEFLSNKYVHLFFIHDFGNVIIKGKMFRPEFNVIQNVGYGDMDDFGNHKIEYKTLQKGLFESGILINNILRFNYHNLGYMGFGVGSFYRYGAYSFDNTLDNFAFKLTLTYSSN